MNFNFEALITFLKGLFDLLKSVFAKLFGEKETEAAA